MKILLLVVLLAIVYTSNAHLCLIAPHQRGTLADFNKEASADCGLQQGPCGGRNPQEPAVEIHPAAQFYATFQKNLNHYNPSNPGNFTISWGRYENPSSFTNLATIPDTNSSSLTLYINQLKFPIVNQAQRGVIQVVYNTNIGLTFYQCADIYLR
eukprot:TRINITY_DN9655_c0_g1_i1.p1 TRINITY_DN9655_c0_g1~~TRINITY_DN9655_c0_g1_i1.p1  ORF type:complete len:164 (-),score=46.56 TRINITY_DN9655_c0_g1_i1:30-494(-)